MQPFLQLASPTVVKQPSEGISFSTDKGGTFGVRGGIAAGGMPALMQMQPWTPTLDIGGLQSEALKGEKLGDDMKEKPSFTAIPMVDTSQMDATKTSAEETKTALEALGITITPNIDSSSVDAFIAKLNSAKALAASLGASAVAASHSLDGIVGRAQRGSFGFGGPRGD